VNDENTLRQKARDAIRAGRLPARAPLHAWAGKGEGATCAVCGLPLTPDDVEFELEFAEVADSGPDPGAMVTRNLHARCFAAWEFERRIPEPE
jgi:hypothetical protein